MEQLLEEADTKWKQKAKLLWLSKGLNKCGTRTQKYLHNCASQKMKTNTILSINDGKDYTSFSQQKLVTYSKISTRMK